MKKIMIYMIFVGLISIMVFPSCVSAKNISTLEASEANGKITVSGKTETGVLAIAAFVYSGDDLVYMETCEANGSSYSCTLNNAFSKGNYVVKVADYNGGDYITKSISVAPVTDNPKTNDNVIYSSIIGILSLFGITLAVCFKKKEKLSY